MEDLQASPDNLAEVNISASEGLTSSANSAEDGNDSQIITTSPKIADTQRKLPTKPAGSTSPEGRRYHILYQELKHKFHNQCKTVEKLNAERVKLKQCLKASEDKCKSLGDQITKFVLENENLRQELKQVESS